MTAATPCAMAAKSMALKYQSPHYPERYHHRVPWKVRMLKTVRPDFAFLLKDPRLANVGAVYECTVNSHGAVAVILPNGEELGVKPDEFEVVDWHGAPAPVVERARGPQIDHPDAWDGSLGQKAIETMGLVMVGSANLRYTPEDRWHWESDGKVIEREQQDVAEAAYNERATQYFAAMGYCVRPSSRGGWIITRLFGRESYCGDSGWAVCCDSLAENYLNRTAACIVMVGVAMGGSRT